MDAEVRRTTTPKEYQDELKRFRLTKELAITKAEMEALNETQDMGDETVGRQDLPQRDGKGHLLQNYLRVQASSVTNTSPLTVETMVESLPQLS